MAPSRKTGFPLELHGAIGSVLHGMRNTLVSAAVFVGNTYTTGAMRVSPRQGARYGTLTP
jgi:hypothetical protein